MTTRSTLARAATALVVFALGASCGFPGTGADDDDSTIPTVLSNTPLDGATGVALDGGLTATFSEAMDPETLTTATFTLTAGDPAVAVQGTVSYADSRVVFLPEVDLPLDGAFTATITTAANSGFGVALAAQHVWRFTGVGAGGAPVNLGTAGDYVILAKSAITTVPTSAVTGNMGISPVAATAITGFGLVLDLSTTFSTSAQVTGSVFAANYGAPTPDVMTAAIRDMERAFTEAGLRVAGVPELGGGNLGGMNLAPGVYRWGTDVMIPTDLTLTGSASSVWIFQIAQALDLTAGTRIVLAGGARPGNVFWQVSGAVRLATMSHLEGVVLGATSVTLVTGASVSGRLLAQTAVTIAGSTIVQPALPPAL